MYLFHFLYIIYTYIHIFLHFSLSFYFKHYAYSNFMPLLSLRLKCVIYFICNFIHNLIGSIKIFIQFVIGLSDNK